MIRDLRAYFTMKTGRMELRERKYKNKFKNKNLAIASNEVLTYATTQRKPEHVTCSERSQI